MLAPERDTHGTSATVCARLTIMAWSGVMSSMPGSRLEREPDALDPSSSACGAPIAERVLVLRRASITHRITPPTISESATTVGENSAALIAFSSVNPSTAAGIEAITRFSQKRRARRLPCISHRRRSRSWVR